MKRAVIASLMAVVLSVSLVGPAWAFDRENKLTFSELSGDRLRFLIALTLIQAQNPPPECRADVPVRLQRRRSGKWRTIKRGRTNKRGRFVATQPRRAGRYRAVAPEFMTKTNQQCFKSVSNTVTVP
jgi:hypothetical protein